MAVDRATATRARAATMTSKLRTPATIPRPAAAHQCSTWAPVDPAGRNVPFPNRWKITQLPSTPQIAGTATSARRYRKRRLGALADGSISASDINSLIGADPAFVNGPGVRGRTAPFQLSLVVGFPGPGGARQRVTMIKSR